METATALDFPALLDVLGFTDGELLSIGHAARRWPALTAGWVAAARTPPAPPSSSTKLTFSTGSAPVEGPAEGKGRGKEQNVTRLSSLWCDLDVKPGGCADLNVARNLLGDLTAATFACPSVIVDSGYGRHVYWPLADGLIFDRDVGPARALLNGGDGWSPRSPKRTAHTWTTSTTWSECSGPRHPQRQAGALMGAPVTARRSGQHPLLTTEVDARLTKVGIDEEDDDRTTATNESHRRPTGSGPTHLPLRREDDRRLAHRLTESAHILAGVREHPGELRTPARLHHRGRLQLACGVLDDRFTWLVRNTEPRREPKRDQLAGKKHSAREYGIIRAAAKTDEAARAELGNYHPDDVAATRGRAFTVHPPRRTPHPQAHRGRDGFGHLRIQRHHRTVLRVPQR